MKKTTNENNKHENDLNHDEHSKYTQLIENKR